MIERVFLSIYRFFEKRKWMLWTLLIVSTVVFAFFGFQLEYEEDMSKLLPLTEEAQNSDIVFDNLKVKDKIFVQFVSRGGITTPEEMTEI